MQRTAPSHRPFHAATAALALLTAAAAPAQGAIITVDDNGGSQYTDIQPAVNAALPGDSVVVAPGSYSGFTVTRGIAVLGQPGAQVTTPGVDLESMKIESIPAGSICSIRGLTFTGLIVQGPQLDACQGRVVLEDIDDSLTGGGDRTITGCTQVAMVNCTTSRLSVSSSAISLDSCTVNGSATLFGFPAITLTNSKAFVSRSTITGGSAIVGSEAISLSNTALVVTSDGTGAIRAGAGGSGQPAIDGTGSMFLDDDAVLIPSGGAAAIGFGIAVTNVNIPSMATTGGPIGGTGSVDLYSEAGDIYFLIAGVPGNITPLPQWNGEFWLDLNFSILVSGGVLNSSARLAFPYNIPNENRLVGITLGWTAVAGTGFGVSLANPAFSVHGM